jgi:hypothetical protein
LANYFSARVARWYILKLKSHFSINFGGSWNYVHILRPIGKFYLEVSQRSLSHHILNTYSYAHKLWTCKARSFASDAKNVNVTKRPSLGQDLLAFEQSFDFRLQKIFQWSNFGRKLAYILRGISTMTNTFNYTSS